MLQESKYYLSIYCAVIPSNSDYVKDRRNKKISKQMAQIQSLTL